MGSFVSAKAAQDENNVPLENSTVESIARYYCRSAAALLLLFYYHPPREISR